MYRIDTVAGTLPDDQGKPATQAILFSPQAVTVGHDGLIYVADAQGVRKITPDGFLFRFALNANTTAITIDRNGTLHYINGGPELYSLPADGQLKAIRPNDLIASRNLTDIALDPDGNLVIPDQGNRRVLRITPGGAVSAIAGTGSGIALNIPPSRIAVDAQNNIYLSLTNQTVVRISPNRSLTIVAGNGTQGVPAVSGPATASPFSSLGALAVSASGELFIAELRHRQILKVGAQGLLELVTTDVSATDLALDARGRLVFLDDDKVWRLEANGSKTLIAGRGQFDGDGAPAVNSLLRSPRAVLVEPSGSLFIGDTGNNRIRKVSGDGIISTVAGTGIPGMEGDGQPAASAQIGGPQFLARGPDGSLYFAQDGYHKIRKLGPDGVIHTVAGNGVSAYTGDGGPAIGASFRTINGLAVDHHGNVYFSDGGSHRVRRITPDGKISTYAGTGQTIGTEGGLAVDFPISGPGALAVDAEGNLLIHQRTPSRLLRVDARTGILSILNRALPLGSPGDDLAGDLCGFLEPRALAVDVDGTLLVAGNQVICRLNHDGRSFVVAGSKLSGFSGDGGPALSATFRAPSGLSVDRDGNIFVADQGNHRIRKLTPTGSTPLPSGPPFIGTTVAVVPAFMGKKGMSSNSYVEIHGANLSQTRRIWTAADFNGQNAPTSLDGVSVNVNGKPAFIYYVSPTQININVPDDSTTGPVPVQVITSFGASNTVTVDRVRISPTLHTAPQFSAGGKQFVIAQTQDFGSFIGNPNLIPGVSFTPAKPGETILIYAVGCGPTTPRTQAGVAAEHNSPVALPHEVRIGGAPARVTFAGIVAGTIGLYQFNVVVPDLLPGDHPIELVVDNVSNGQDLLITVGN